MDSNNGIKFLLDTGAKVLCIRAPSNAVLLAQLSAVNQTAIAMHDTRKLSINLGFDDIFESKFLLADVPVGILSVDFLAHHRISIDPGNLLSHT